MPELFRPAHRAEADPAGAATGAVRISWRADGPIDRPALLLSNSLGSTLALWDDVVARLAGRYHVIRSDIRGHGESAVLAGDYSIADLGGDALAVLDAAGAATASFCGISLGGLTGLWLALHAPGRLDRLVLANTGARIGATGFWNDRIGAVRANGMAGIVEGLLGRWFTADFAARHPGVIARYRAMLLGADPTGYAGCCAAVRDADFRTDLARVATPTLVIAGDQDVATPPALGEELAAGIPGARLAVLPAAHLSNVEQADAFAALLLEFLPH